jgi:rhodanese-related sulfurtransferase
VPGALNIPLEQLRQRRGELPPGRALLLYCQVGQRAYYATRMLMQLGHDVRNLSGGYMTFAMVTGARGGSGR